MKQTFKFNRLAVRFAMMIIFLIGAGLTSIATERSEYIKFLWSLPIMGIAVYYFLSNIVRHEQNYKLGRAQ